MGERDLRDPHALFAAQMHVVVPAERRPASRTKLRLETAAGTAGNAPDIAIVIHDLSASGFRGEGWLAVDPGTIVEIELPGIGPRAAVVVWRGGRFAGCRFVRPLTPEMLRLVRSRAPVIWGAFDTVAGTRAMPAEQPFDEPRLGWRTRVAAILAINALLWLAGLLTLRALVI